jgi:hypothetical protein
MTGYLQRLLDTAAPAAEAPTLTPVVKSASPIFDQNQLPGLAGLYAGEGEAEITPQVGAAPDVPASRAPTPLPPAPSPDVPTLEITRRNPLPLPPTPDAVVRRPMAEDPSTPHRAPAAAHPALPQKPPAGGLEPVRPDFKIIEPSPRLETVLLAEPLQVTDAPAPLMPSDPAFSPAAIELVASRTEPAIEREVPLQPEETGRLAGSPAGAAAREVLPIEPTSDAPLRPSVLEPRPRPDFEAADPAAAEPRPEPLPAPPRITIGRVTVALVPDPAPGAAPAAPRTAAAASLIGPLGNRRARRRLFALARL